MKFHQKCCSLLLLSAAGLQCGSSRPSPPVNPRLQSLPRLTLWAWERREDLREIEPNTYAVAYLDQTILPASEPRVVPRMQPLEVPGGTKLIAVVRIETAPFRRYSPDFLSKVTNMVLTSATRPNVSALQIDFDASVSQRSFYRALLRQVRAKMPQGMALSITALASWCSADDWLADLPIDEAVPMFFRMGRDAHPLQPGWSYPVREPKCQDSAGLSMDESWPAISPQQRLYVFHPHAWNSTALYNLREMVHQ